MKSSELKMSMCLNKNDYQEQLITLLKDEIEKLQTGVDTCILYIEADIEQMQRLNQNPLMIGLLSSQLASANSLLLRIKEYIK